MCKWIDWRERKPDEDEAGFVLFLNTVTMQQFVQVGSIITGPFWFDFLPLAWMPYPNAPEPHEYERRDARRRRDVDTDREL